jgi:hypothetical protein
MSNRSRREAASRAEARRRSRQLDRGGPPVEDEEEPAAGSTTARPGPPAGLLGRLFPTAPPLPNKPDPLAGFRYQGPFRSAVAGLYLIGNHPRAWLLLAIPWAAAQTLAYLSPPSYSPIQITTVLVSVFAVIAAGWLGWEKPWLFGLAAVVAGTLIEAVLLALLIGPLPIEGSTGWMQIFLGVIVFQIVQLQWALGAMIGWYGGYLRRRMAVTQVPSQGRRRSR